MLEALKEKVFHANLDAENTLDNPNLITPKESSISIEGNTLNTEIGAMTFAVYKFKKESK